MKRITTGLVLSVLSMALSSSGGEAASHSGFLGVAAASSDALEATQNLIGIPDPSSFSLGIRDLPFLFTWYGDGPRVRAAARLVIVETNDINTLSFGISSSIFTSDQTAPNWSLLHVAAVRNSPEIVRYLIENGADPSNTGRHGDCPSPLELLLSRRASQFGTVWESRDAYVSMALLLLESGASVSDSSILASAIATSSKPVVKAILKAGANPNAVPPDGTPPLVAAAFLRLPEITDLLLAHGADPSGTNSMGMTVYDAALAYPELRTLSMRKALMDMGLRLPERRMGDSDSQSTEP